MINLGALLVILLRLCFMHLATATNYCDPALCTTNQQVKPHIGCKNSGQFLKSCEEPSIVPITPQLQRTILFLHNDLRNKVANGSLARFESAQRMTTMTWDSELEYLAGLNVLTCVLEHDECHNTPEYRYSGQNLAIQYQSTTISSAGYETIIGYLINEWFNENKDANQRDMEKCTSSGLSKDIGHYTAMVQEKSAKVGCGIAKFAKVISGRKWNAFLMACDYSFTNMIGMPIYIKGPICSGCQTGCNPDFNGLCSVSEYVPPIHDLDERPANVPAAPSVRSPLTLPPNQPTQQSSFTRNIQPSNNQLTRPAPPVPSARLQDLMRTAERVVRPFEPGQTFYIRDEPNPAVRNNEIIRPVPIVTWRGPRTTVNVPRVKWPFEKFTRF